MPTVPTTETTLAPYLSRTVRTWPGDGPGHRVVEGTLVVADVSGFTRLTERLARRGKVGSEEILTTISDVWEALLASDDGGDVLKFAGDALIVFHQGPGHAQRACQGALAMQRELARVGRILTGSGAVRLRMSIGVHSGTFHLFMVGDDHAELLVLGEDATATIDMQSAASPGQVVAAEATVQQCAGVRLGPAVGGGWVVRSVPPLPPEPRWGDGPERPDLARFVAPPLRGRLGSIDHEHRWVVVAFVHVAGLDDLLRETGTNEAFDRAQAFTRGLMEVLAEHDVLLTSSDLGRDGPGFMLTAGAPESRGDDERRMLRAARRIVSIDAGLPVRVGVAAGNVFVGDVGPPFRRAYVTMGDIANLAARLVVAAPAGGVLAGTPVLAAAGDGFATTPVEPFTVKGKRRAVEAALVDDIVAVAGVHAGAGPLIGRDEERQSLLQALEDARRGDGRVVELVGEEGSGKSRLVAEVLAEAEEMRTVSVTCDVFERTSPFHAARTLLRQILGISPDASPEEAGAAVAAMVEDLVPEMAPLTPILAVALDAAIPMTLQSGEVAERYRRVRAQQVMARLVEAAATEPLVVVVENASLMDDASAEMIAEILRTAGSRSWLVVVTRSGDGSGLHPGRGYEATVIRLAPLSAEAATNLALLLAETNPIPRHLVDEVVARSAGNPLFLSELMAGIEGGAEMPHSVEALVAARIDALSPGDRHALRLLSVLGEHFEVSILDEVFDGMEVPPWGDIWDRLSGFVRMSGGIVEFASPLVRLVAYDGLPYGWRREIHGRLADALRGRRDDAIAVHLARAQRWSEAWEEARRSGDRARRAGAHAVAAELYDLALEAARHVAPPDQDLVEVATSAGEMWRRVGVPAKALDAYGTALAAATDPAVRVMLAGRRAAVHEEAGRYSQALGLYSRALAEARTLADPVERHRCLGLLHAGYASTRHRQGRHAEALEHGGSAVVDAELAGDRATLAHAYHLLDRIHTDMGDRATALRYRDAALPIFAELGDLAAQGTVLHDLAADAHRSGRLEEAAWLYERASDARVRVGDVVRAAATINALGEVDHALGNLAEAEGHFSEALRTWRGARSPEGIATASLNLGTLRLETGDVAGAMERLEEAVSRAGSIGAEAILTRARAALAEAFVRAARWVEAWESATDALLVASDPIVAGRCHRVRAAALAATGGGSRAEDELRQADELERSVGDQASVVAPS